MNKCKKCKTADYSRLVIVTETTFGHGDSQHTTYVECKTCGNRSGSFTDHGFFEDRDLRKAQAHWNDQNAS